MIDSPPSPLWIAHSGLPRQLAEACGTPLAWLLFHTIVEQDCLRHRAPGVVEISIEQLGALSGMTAEQAGKTLKKLRKSGAVRFFLPDNDEEEALFQIVAPLPTPISWEDVRRNNSAFANWKDETFRYARAAADEPRATGREDADPKLREVIDLYFDNVSMKMNSFILDELALIARQCDMALIRKVFARAHKREVQGLSWILSEIRREQKVRGQGSGVGGQKNDEGNR